jgi:D-amino peptidase
MMHALISADMEGATGVTCPDDVRPGSPQWDRFRRLLTGDVQAVCQGFFDAGVTEVTVNEAHASMRNVLLEELDPRVRLLTGNHKPFGMMEGIQRRPDLVAFVGYHAGPGEPGVLSHTFVASAVFEVTLNGRAMTEGYLNSLLVAEYGARLALVAGDDLTCVDAEDYAPEAQKVAVKEAIDRYTALCMPPARTASLLRSAAAAGAQSAQVPPLPPGPYRCEVTFVGTSSATMAACIPTVQLLSPRTVAFTKDTIADLYPCFRVVTRIAQAATEPDYG